MTTTSEGPANAGRHADGAADLQLGERHATAARADDDVDGRDGLGPVGHGGDRLWTADTVELVHSRQACRGEHLGRDGTIGRGRHADHDGPHAGDTGRDRGHENARGVAREPARHVDPGAGDRQLEEVDRDPVALEGAGIARPMAVECLDGLGCLPERVEEGRV